MFALLWNIDEETFQYCVASALWSGVPFVDSVDPMTPLSEPQKLAK